jgi:hypothetical protein
MAEDLPVKLGDVLVHRLQQVNHRLGPFSQLIQLEQVKVFDEESAGFDRSNKLGSALAHV